MKDISPKRVLVYDRGGEFQRVIGREEGWAGELEMPHVVLIVDDTLTIPDAAKGRFLRWSLDGDWLGDGPANSYQAGSHVLALRNGAVLTQADRPNGQTVVTSIRRVSLVGEAPYEFPALTVEDATFTVDGRQRRLILDEAPTPTVATDRRSGTVYLGHGEAYQVAAYGQDGTPKWGIKVAAPRYTITRAAKRTAVDRLARMGAMFGGAAAVSIGDVAWPEFAGAIRALHVDGRGRLYVFPRVSGTTDRAAPVDVFSPEGELLFSGTMPLFHWGDVVDDYIYTWDPIDHESMQTVVRYKLVAPFIDPHDSP